MSAPVPTGSEAPSSHAVAGLGARLLRNLSLLSVSQVVGLAISVTTVSVLSRGTAAWLWLDEPTRSACLILSLIVPVQALSLSSVVLQARVQIKRGVVAELSNRLIGFAAMMAAVTAGWGLPGVVAGLVVGEVAGVVVMSAMTRTAVRLRPRIDVAVWRHLLRASLTVGGAGILSALVNRLDFFMLEEMVGLQAVGYYGAAYRLPMLLERLPLLALATVFPLMARLAADDRAGLKAVYRWALWRAAMVALPVVVVVYVGAPWILEWWTGPEFLPGVPALRWLILATGCMYLAVVAGNVLIVTRRTRTALIIWLIAAPANVVLNWWWIPGYGPTGAAAATCVTFVMVLILSLTAAERELT